MTVKNIFRLVVHLAQMGMNDDRRAPGKGRRRKKKERQNLNTENLQEGLRITFWRRRFKLQPARRA